MGALAGAPEVLQPKISAEAMTSEFGSCGIGKGVPVCLPIILSRLRTLHLLALRDNFSTDGCRALFVDFNPSFQLSIAPGSPSRDPRLAPPVPGELQNGPEFLTF
jgi:hypothetical protein